MIKYLLLDFDGVVAMSEELHAASVCHVHERVYGLEGCEGFLSVYGGGSHVATFQNIQKKYSQKYTDFGSWCADLAAYIGQHEDRIVARDGIFQAIQWWAKNHKGEMCIVTNTAPLVLDAILPALKAQYKAEGYGQWPVSFTIAAGETAMSLPKPNPMGYLVAMERFKANRDECLIVEDSNTGILSATAAQVDHIHWSHGEDAGMLLPLLQEKVMRPVAI